MSSSCVPGNEAKGSGNKSGMHTAEHPRGRGAMKSLPNDMYRLFLLGEHGTSLLILLPAGLQSPRRARTLPGAVPPHVIV